MVEAVDVCEELTDFGSGEMAAEVVCLQNIKEDPFCVKLSQ
jgi:hypothetical protein